MQIEKKDVITENDKSNIRQKALLKELNRLKNLTHQKYKEIYLYRVCLIVLFIGIISIYYHFQQNTIQATPINKNLIPEQKKHNNSSTKLNMQTIYYSVAFENANNYPLAQFKNITYAEDFTRQISKMNFPKVVITRDSICRISNNKHKQFKTYAIQLGAYNVDLLKKYHNNLIWLQFVSEDDYFKYRFAPFNKYDKIKAFARQLKMEEPYILKY